MAETKLSGAAKKAAEDKALREAAKKELEMEAAVKESNPDPKTEMKKAKAPEEPEELAQSIQAQVKSIGKRTAALLKAQRQIKVQVPIDKLNKSDKYAVVGINGWNFQIEKGKPVKLPEAVVKLLENGGYAPTRLE